MKIGQWRVAVLCVVGTFAHAAESTALPGIALQQDGIALQRWLVFGAFKAKAGEAAVEVDFLADLGPSEADCRSADLIRWAADLQTATKGKSRARQVEGSDEVNFGALYNSEPPLGSNAPQTAVYAACEIASETEREAWLLFGSDDGAKIWLNGQLQYNWAERRAVVPNGDAIRLPLHRGLNLLLIKVANIDRGWAMRARLEPDIASATATALAGDGTILKRAIVPVGSPLGWRNGLPASLAAEVKLESYDRKITRMLRVGSDALGKMADLPRGLYRVSLRQGMQTYAQNFYWGGSEEIHPDLLTKCADAMTDPRAAINFDTLLRWLDLLLHPAKPAADDDEWTREMLLGDQEKKAIYAVTEIYDALLLAAHGTDGFRHRPGLHLRGFRSPVDDQVLNYRLFVPSSYRPDGAGLPLVVVEQTVFTRRAPYLESVYVGGLREAEEWSQVAEKLGVGILWPGYRVCPYGNPADLAHLDEVLASVAADYQIDPGRLYLYGFCSGGLTASMEAVRRPTRYAGIAYLNPVLHRVKNRFDDDGQFSRWPAYRSWLNETDPIVALASIDHLPIWIIHDGIDAGHGPLSHSVDLVEQSRAMGHPLRFERNRDENPPPTRLTLVERQLSWLAEQHRAAPAPLGFLPDNIGGPLARVFAERFTLVEATGGNEDERAANARLSIEFQDAWRRTNYGPCRVIKDRELTSEEEQRSHLVLLGNAETNLEWKRLATRLPIKMNPSRLEINGRVYEGDGLALQAWFPHPEYTKRKVILIGSVHPEQAVFGTLELALDGWFDYAVWKKTAQKPVLLAAERSDAARTSTHEP